MVPPPPPIAAPIAPFVTRFWLHPPITLGVAVPTLELKISFFEAMGPGIVYAEGRVMRWGGSVGFLDGDLKDEKGRLIVHSTSTIKIVRPKAKA